MFESILSNPLYIFGALVGLCIGIFYGFDGWRGDIEVGDLKDSPRVKNLLWILGPAAVAFFGDIHALDAEAKNLCCSLRISFHASWAASQLFQYGELSSALKG